MAFAGHRETLQIGEPCFHPAHYVADDLPRNLGYDESLREMVEDAEEEGVVIVLWETGPVNADDVVQILRVEGLYRILVAQASSPSFFLIGTGRVVAPCGSTRTFAFLFKILNAMFIATFAVLAVLRWKTFEA